MTQSNLFEGLLICHSKGNAHDGRRDMEQEVEKLHLYPVQEVEGELEVE